MGPHIYIDSISSPFSNSPKSTSRKDKGKKRLVQKGDSPYNPAIFGVRSKARVGVSAGGVVLDMGSFLDAEETASRLSGPFVLEVPLERSQSWIADPKLKSAMGAKPFALFQSLVQHLYSKKRLFAKKPILSQLGFMSRRQMIWALGKIESPESYSEIEAMIRYLESGTPWGGWIKAFYVNGPNMKHGATRFWIPLRLLKRKMSQVFSAILIESKPVQALEIEVKKEEGKAPPWVLSSIKTLGFSRTFSIWATSGFATQ